jgi:hypothetical protein
MLFSYIFSNKLLQLWAQGQAETEWLRLDEVKEYMEYRMLRSKLSMALAKTGVADV